MPTSNLHLAPMVCDMVRETGARSVLDVGPGWGKFGVLLREYADVEHIDAVEAWEPYVTTHNLTAVYDAVFTSDVLDLAPPVFAEYDLVLMSEVIEHLDRDLALELLDRIPGWVVITTPTRWRQRSHDVPTEIHRSLWTLPDFESTGRVDVAHENLGEFLVRLRPAGGGG